MALSNTQKLLRKAVLLSVAFVIVLIVANNLISVITKGGTVPTKHVPKLVMNKTNVAILNEDEKDPLKQKISGMWQCTSVRNAELPCVSVTDRFELKTNGIFWRVKHNTVNLPTGDSAIFVQIETGYMNPFSRMKAHTDSLTFEVHILGLIMIHGSDTCFGEINTDTVWDAFANGKDFILDGRTYAAYDTAALSKHDFFPAGAIRLMDKISIPACGDKVSLAIFAKEKISAAFAQQNVETRTAADIAGWVETYYRGVSFHPLARWESYNSRGTMSIAFDVLPSGTVTSAKVTNASPRNLKLEAAVEKEVNTWIFPKCSKEKTDTKVSCDLTY